MNPAMKTPMCVPILSSVLCIIHLLTAKQILTYQILTSIPTRHTTPELKRAI